MIGQIVTGVSNLFWFQDPSSWRPDLFSCLVGLALGLAAASLFLLALPHLRNLYVSHNNPTNTGQERRPSKRTSHEERFHAATARLAARWHLARDLAPIEQLFVPPLILAEPSPIHPGKPLPLATSQLAILWPELAAQVAVPPPPTISLRELLLNGGRVVLASPSGSGKSMLLAFCASLCAHATANGSDAFLLPVIPVLLHFADLHAGPGATAEDSITPLVDALHGRAGELSRTELAHLLQRKLEAGHVLLLLDGWSEINGDARAYATSWLRRVLAQYPAIQVFVATASRGFEPLLDAGFTLSGVAPWRAAQAHKLVELWAHRFQAPAPALEEFWAPHQSALETTLRLWSRFLGLPAPDIPFPALIASTIAQFAQEKATQEIPAARLEKLWQAMAFAALQEDDVELAPAQVQELAAELSAASSLASLDGAALQGALREAPLFSPGNGRHPRFVSTLWRDHLAAAHIARDEQQKLIRECLGDPRWAEVTRQFAFHAPVEHLADWLLEANPGAPFFDDVFLLAEWLAISDGPGEWRRRALVRLAQLVVKPDVPNVQRQRAIAALARCPEQGVVELLRQLLQRSDTAVRQAAVAAVARLDAGRSIPLLQQMLKDADASVRAAAVHALGWQQDEEAEQLLLLALIGRDERMRLAAVEALALGGPPAWRVLRDAAKDEDMHVRRAAAQGLATLDQKWAGDLLRKMKANDDQWMVRSAALSALEERARRRRPRPWVPAQASDLDWMVQWAARHEQAVPGGAAAVTMLCEFLGTASQPSIRAAAARSLAQVAIPSEERQAVWASLWQAARNDGSGAVREAAYATLAFLQRVRGARMRGA